MTLEPSQTYNQSRGLIYSSPKFVGRLCLFWRSALRTDGGKYYSDSVATITIPRADKYMIGCRDTRKRQGDCLSPLYNLVQRPVN